MEQISATTLQQWLTDATRSRPVLIDVREPWEFERCRIEGARSMPLATVPSQFASLDREADLVMVCHHGARSFQAGMFLEQQGFGHVINLQGGVAAWARDVDPSMPTY